MAKGLRSSVKKSHRTRLRSRVFAPVEDARTERLSAKLLELASQPRPAKTDMELDEDNGSNTIPTTPTAPLTHQIPRHSTRSNSSPASKSDAQADAHQDQQAEEEDLFYSLLGVCSDIVGFDKRGDLLLAFDHMDIDDGTAPAAAAAAAAAKTATTTSSTSSKLKKKSPRVQKKRRGKPASTIKFPARRRDGVKASSGRKGKR
ncbi:uncharacterized protein K441DRAFT_545089 [Cenococcum geophilum 1.58]|uniref:uncharacterized protein n=1 Tax=Cenococcum geophilum 1.58 TaxID=794803 RepID=UPI00358EFDED|nr:hypothetical protein K441DRAFT_545089 [Cenococcum geophilum 1.58]